MTTITFQEFTLSPEIVLSREDHRTLSQANIDQNRVSSNDPIGAALIGLRAGQSIT
jgi:transcription elongation GreA/GreB family factor